MAYKMPLPVPEDSERITNTLSGDLRAIVQDMKFWRDHPQQAFDVQANRFYAATRMLAPGKDCPEWFGHSDDERKRAWDEWCEKQHSQRMAILSMAADRLERADELERALRTVYRALVLEDVEVRR